MQNIVDNYRRSMNRPVEDIARFRFWRAVIAEFFGMFILTAVGCGSCLSNWMEEGTTTQNHVLIALSFGLILQAVCWSIGFDSGGHVNPAITLGSLAVGRIGLVRAAFYIIIQLVGATAGAGMVYGLTPKAKRANLGVTDLRSDLSVGQGVGVEVFITFILAFTVAASCDRTRNDLSGSAPLTIGLTVTACHLFAIKYTGASMNPARTFGPALVTAYWRHHWIYWVGPVIGAVTAMFLYETLFVAEHSKDEALGVVREGAAGGSRQSTSEEGGGSKRSAPAFLPNILKDAKDKQEAEKSHGEEPKSHGEEPKSHGEEPKSHGEERKSHSEEQTK